MTSSSSGGPAPATPVPVCPRHPDRESYVRCQRCERPTCPQCQRPAAVGIQCVDCVAEGSRTVRTGRTTFGGRVRQGRPVVTLAVIGLCVLAWLLQRVPGTTAALGFVPALAGTEPWRFLTAAFLHSPTNVTHILFNMLALWMTGPYLEALLGRLRFAALYLLCAVGGSVGSLLLSSPLPGGWWNAGWYTLSVGASGAVFGLFGALLIVQRRLRQDFRQILAVIVLNGVIGFVAAGIAWQAHLGGLVTGVLLGLVLAHAPRRNRSVVQLAGTAGIAVVLVLAALAKTAVTG